MQLTLVNQSSEPFLGTSLLECAHHLPCFALHQMIYPVTFSLRVVSSLSVPSLVVSYRLWGYPASNKQIGAQCEKEHAIKGIPSPATLKNNTALI